MVTILDHPLINHKLTIMRNKETKSKDFKANLDEIGMLMSYEVTKDLAVESIGIDTPMTYMNADTLKKPIILVPILRAGLGLLSGFQSVISEANVGFIGMARNEKTLQPEEYYANFPASLKDATVIVLDPMLATGGSSSAAITKIKERGATDIKLVCIVGAPEGVKVIENDHPDVPLYLATLDDGLNENGYIIPGLGDAGDRIFGSNE